MALNVKILLDPKFYYQKLKELANKSKDTFSSVGSDIAKVFSGIRDNINKTSVKSFAEQFVLAGSVMDIFKKGLEGCFKLLDTVMQNSKQRFLDYFNGLKEAADTYAAYEKRQQQVNSDNSSALEKLSGLQLSGPALNHTQREEQRQALEMLRKTYRGLKIDIDEATGKIKNFEEIQSKVLSSDQKKELILVQQQIKYLEKQNKVGQHNITYKGGFFSEYIEDLKEAYNWGTAQEIGGALKANVDKLMELRYREFDLKYRDRAADASALYKAKKQDMQTQVQRNPVSDSIQALSEQIQLQSLLNQGLEETAMKQRIINELKRKGLEYDQTTVDKLFNLQKQLGAEKLKSAQKTQAESLYEQALRVSGRVREADQKQAIRTAETAKGSALTDEEKAMTLKLLELSSELQKLSEKPEIQGDFAIRTNELTARGGFQTGVRIPDTTMYQKQIANNTGNHYSAVQRIETMLKEMIGQ